VEKVLWNIVNRAYPPGQLIRRFKDVANPDAPLPSIVRFQSSATEREIWRGLLCASDAREHVIAFFREIDNIQECAEVIQIEDFVDLDALSVAEARIPLLERWLPLAKPTRGSISSRRSLLKQS
jgi:hypothetical protein